MKQILDHWHSLLAWMLVPVYHTGELYIYIYMCVCVCVLGSKDLGFYVFRTLICIVNKP